MQIYEFNIFFLRGGGGVRGGDPVVLLTLGVYVLQLFVGVQENSHPLNILQALSLQDEVQRLLELRQGHFAGQLDATRPPPHPFYLCACVFCLGGRGGSGSDLETSIDKPTACVVDTLLACRAQLGVTNSLLNEIATDLDA